MKRSRLVTAAAMAFAAVALLSAPSSGSAAPQTAAKAAPIVPAASIVPKSCLYPPITAPAITATSTKTLTGLLFSYYTVNGSVKANSCGLALWSVNLYRSTDGVNYTWAALALTDLNGNYRFSGVPVGQKTFVKVVAAAQGGLGGASSSVITLTR